MIFTISVSLTFRTTALKLLPILVGSIILVLAAVELYVEIVTSNKAGVVTQEAPSEETKGEVRRFFSAMGWLVGFFLGIYLLGILLATPLFTMSYLRFRRRGWLISMGVSIIMFICIYGAFQFALNTPLYRGILFGG